MGSSSTSDLIVQFFESIDRCLSQYREITNYLHLCAENVLEESDLVSTIFYNHEKEQRFIVFLLTCNNCFYSVKSKEQYGISLSGKPRGCASILTVQLCAPLQLFNREGFAFEAYNKFVNRIPSIKIAFATEIVSRCGCPEINNAFHKCAKTDVSKWLSRGSYAIVPVWDSIVKCHSHIDAQAETIVEQTKTIAEQIKT